MFGSGCLEAVSGGLVAERVQVFAIAIRSAWRYAHGLDALPLVVAIGILHALDALRPGPVTDGSAVPPVGAISAVYAHGGCRSSSSSEIAALAGTVGTVVSTQFGAGEARLAFAGGPVTRYTAVELLAPEARREEEQSQKQEELEDLNHADRWTTRLPSYTRCWGQRTRRSGGQAPNSCLAWGRRDVLTAWDGCLS